MRIDMTELTIAFRTFRGRLQTDQLMLYKEIIAVCSQNHTKHINTLCGQNVELLCVKPSGTNSEHWGLKDKHKKYARSPSGAYQQLSTFGFKLQTKKLTLCVACTNSSNINK